MKKKLLALSVLTAISSQANAFQFNTGDDWAIRWDNTVKGNLMVRTEKQDKDVYTNRYGGNPGAGWFLADDGALSVDRGDLVSSRLDILSEMDIIWKDDFGFRISGAGWYDPQYGSDSDYPEDRYRTWGQPTVKPGEYTDDAEDLHYLGGELLDAFVFANWDIGDTALGVRAGRHTIYWGNSLLGVGAVSSIGGAMAPLDFNKALAVPGSEAKELFMPTNKISAVFQPTDNLTLNAYYTLEFQRYRLPESGTYFAPITGLTEDSEFIVFPPPPSSDPADLTSSVRPGYRVDYDDKDADGDYGFNVQYFIDAWNLETSFIYLNYVDKNLHGGQIAGDFARAAPVLGFPLPGPPPETKDDWDPGALSIGDGFWVFKDDIDLYAVSFAKEMFDISFGLDIVYRKNTGLAQSLTATLTQVYNVPEGLNDLVTSLSPFVPLVNKDGTNMTREQFFSKDSGSTIAAVGDVWSVVFNGVGLLNADLGLWEGGSYIFEATFTQLDDCTSNCQILDNRIKEDQLFTNLAFVFRPTWYQVFPGTDLTVPVTFSYNLGNSEKDKSPFTFGGDGKSGSGSVGAELLVNQSWTVRGAYNYRFGPVNAGIGGLLKDRDNFTVTVKRTF